jgi:hypothetical protein
MRPKLRQCLDELSVAKAAKPPDKRSERQLTNRMLEVIGKDDDPAAPLEAEEAVWETLMQRAKPKEQARLRAMSADEQKKLIAVATEHYYDEVFRDSANRPL